MDTGEGAAQKTTVAVGSTERTAILMAGLPAAMIFTTMAPVLQRMQDAIASGPDGGMLVRTVLNIVGLSMMIGSLGAGAIVDRIGVRQLMIVASLVWIAMGCADYFVSDIHLLILSRFVEGLAAAALVVTSGTMLGELPDEVARGRLGGFQIMIATIAGLLTLVLAGVLADIDWRYPFLLHLLALPLFLSAKMLRPLAAPRRAARIKPAGFWRQFPLGLSLIAFMGGIVTFAITTYMPYCLKAVGVGQATLIGAAMTAQSATIALSSAFFGRLRTRFSARSCFVASFLLIAAGTMLAGFAHHYWVLVIALLITGSGVGPIVPNLFALASAAPNGERGRVVGVVKSCHYSAALIGALALEPAMRWNGAGGVMQAVSLIAAFVGCAVLAAPVSHGRFLHLSAANPG